MARIGWYGETDQWQAYHTWLLEPRGRGDYLRSHGGDRHRRQPEEARRSDPGRMHRGHDLWNISLKFLCESTRD